MRSLSNFFRLMKTGLDELLDDERGNNSEEYWKRKSKWLTAGYERAMNNANSFIAEEQPEKPPTPNMTLFMNSTDLYSLLISEFCTKNGITTEDLKLIKKFITHFRNDDVDYIIQALDEEMTTGENK